MITRRLAAGLALALASATAAAQNFPSKAITLVVPNPPGGIVDSSARLVSEPLGKLLGQPVIVDNRPGASGNIAYGAVAKAPKDGYTLLSSYSAYHVGNPSLFAKLPWTQAELAPVALVAAGTNVITVHPSVPVNNLKEFIAYLKANPGKVNYASQGNGSLAHVGTVLFEQATGTEMTHIPYKGSGAAIQDVLGGQVQVFITTPPSVMGHVQSGKLKALAVTSKTRHPTMPNVPTTAEAGLPGFELEAWVALFAPAGTPPDAIAKLTVAAREALKSPEAVEKIRATGMTMRYLTPTELDGVVKSDLAYWSKVITDAKIKAD